MSYPVGTVAICRAPEGWDMPVWVKTAHGWLGVLMEAPVASVDDSIKDEDFDKDWFFIEPENAGGYQ